MAGINHSFGATGSSPEVIVKTGIFKVDGTFSGTVELQYRIHDEWIAIGSYTAATSTSDDTAFDLGTALPVRFECTAYTSGTINVDLEGQ